MRRIGKMKKIIVSLSLVALFLGCNRQELESVKPVSDVKTILTIGVDESKTILGDLEGGARQLYWANGDSVNVNGHNSAQLSGIAEGCTSTTFSFDTLLEPPYDAVYPGGIYESPTQVTLPALAENTIFPLAGRSMNPKFGLGAITSVLKLSVKQSTDPDKKDTHKLARIEVTSATQQLSGLFDIDFALPAITPASDAADDKKVAIAGNWTLSETTETDFFIPVPAGEYGFTVKLTDAKGHYMTVSTTSDKKFEVGQIKPLKTIVFEPTGTDLDVVISSAQDLIDFATAYNNGDFDNPVVGLAQDIAFDSETSDSFNSTGGIGSGSENPFSGNFTGEGYSITGLTASVPVFAAVGIEGLVEDLTLASSCAFTRPSTYGSHFGSLVGLNYGVVSNCLSAAALTMNLEDNATFCYGGLVGQVIGGSVEGSSFTGSIIFNKVTLSNKSNICIGGVAGSLTNGGLMDGSDYNGSMQFRDPANPTNTTAGPTVQNLYVGGIVGNVDGTVYDCNLLSSASLDIRGIGNKLCVGGIAGLNTKGTVDQCDNSAKTLYVRQNSSSDNSPAYIAGIVGQNGGTVSNCTNRTDITHNVKHKTLASAGIVGQNTGTIESCVNYNKVQKNQGSYLSRYTYVGGIVGLSVGLDVTDVENKGSISTIGGGNANAKLYLGGVFGMLGDIDATETQKFEPEGMVKNSGTVSLALTDSIYTVVSVGGVMGYTVAELDGGSTTKYISNTSAVSVTPTKIVNGLSVAGVVGRTTANVKGATNSGSVTFTGYRESGSATTVGQATKNGYVGGIVGYTDQNITISSCSNSAQIKYIKSNDVRNDQCPTYVGGIAGFMASGGTISSCDNTGYCWNQNFCNGYDFGKAAFTGGIVGALAGNSTTAGSINQVTSKANTVRGKRGCQGGIAGYVSYTTVEDAECEMVMNGTATSARSAGLVNTMVASTIKDSYYLGSMTGGSNAGLVYTMDATSEVKDCTMEGTLAIANGGAVVSVAVAGSKVTHCGVKGTIGGTTITLANIDVSNKATVSECYLLP